MTHNGIVVERLEGEDFSAAAHIISQALAPTANSLALWGGSSEEHRARIEKAVRIATLEHPQGLTLGVRLDGRLVGAVYMIKWPCCQVSTWEGLRLMPKLWSATRGILLRSFLLRSIRLQSIGAKIDPQEPHWHLGPIGILPGLQSRGIGKRLIRGMCDVIDQSGVPGYLETDQQAIVDYHLRLGFRVLREVDILGVHNWCMWRPPQPPAEA